MSEPLISQPAPNGHGEALWNPQAHMPTARAKRLVITSGEGAWLTTSAGQRLLDATASLWHANIGHGRERLARAAYDQMRKLETYHTFGRFANEPALRLADRLVALGPIPGAKVMLTSGGSDSVDLACKLARRHWQLEGRGQKTVILSRHRAYHGLHAFGTSIAGLEFNREGYGTESLVPETARVPLHDAEQIARTVADIGSENIAALVTEPVQGTGGVNPPATGYLDAVQKICRDNDILLILDEVITGFGRTGAMFAAQRYGVRPDLVTFAKGVTSGYAPLGGVLVAPRIWEPFYRDEVGTPVFRHGATYAGHATASAVALCHLDILDRDRLLPRVTELEAVLRDALDGLAQRQSAVVDVRVAGLLGGVTLADHLAAEHVADDMIDLGFITRPLRGNTLQISPPFIVSDDELVAFVAAIEHAVTARENR
jgi:adenosylmethionine-8-amino-7-oxononanoate aminotransferase